MENAADRRQYTIALLTQLLYLQRESEPDVNLEGISTPILAEARVIREKLRKVTHLPEAFSRSIREQTQEDAAQMLRRLSDALHETQSLLVLSDVRGRAARERSDDCLVSLHAAERRARSWQPIPSLRGLSWREVLVYPVTSLVSRACAYARGHRTPKAHFKE